MPSRSLDPDTALSVHLSAIMGRNRFTSDPDPVIDELVATAAGRDDVLTAEVGRWVGCNQEDQYAQRLIAALRASFSGLEPHIARALERRVSAHTSHQFDRR